jgi:hypothetical protein
VTTATDEFYRDIIEGLAIHSGSAFQSDVLATISRHDERDLGVAFNKNQMASKLWLRESLLEATGAAYANVTILGGWFGVLAAVLLHDPRFAIGRITSVDIDRRCEAIARSVNATHVRLGKFEARTVDMLDLDYGPPIESAADPRAMDLVINTSCEHLADFGRWWEKIPAGQQVVLQSNDYYACTQHVNCVRDLAAFRAQAPMKRLIFAGERRMKRYTRFMLIGRK